MKKLLFINCIIFVFYFLTHQVNAETWVCSFTAYNNQIIDKVFIRENNEEFIIYYNDTKIPLIKTFENDKYLHLVMSYGSYMDATVINKITQKAESVGISESKPQDINKAYANCLLK
tara:strand:+ start:427 stop:777 length:351 start_codon:yes stop_codon:yes gene_type:complete